MIIFSILNRFKRGRSSMGAHRRSILTGTTNMTTIRFSVTRMQLCRYWEVSVLLYKVLTPECVRCMSMLDKLKNICCL